VNGASSETLAGLPHKDDILRSRTNLIHRATLSGADVQPDWPATVTIASVRRALSRRLKKKDDARRCRQQEELECGIHGRIFLQRHCELKPALLPACRLTSEATATAGAYEMQ
jgi:hypothetical protein